MDNQITVREMTSPGGLSRFWEELENCRDSFSDPADGDRESLLGPTCRASLASLRTREGASLRCLFFQREGRDLGFAMPVLRPGEDGRCFLTAFCVFPEFRGSGTGRACASALLDWGRGHGAAYFELNAGTDRLRRFWRSVGFLPNGRDEAGTPLMLLPPEERVPFTVERLDSGKNPALGRQLERLENSFLAEIGEEALDAEKTARLAEAVRSGRITFFLARRGYRAVGMCSVSPCFSTFACAETGVFDDFFVEPAFRRQGAARLLAEAARRWCRERGMASLTVGCWPGDADMYRALGFAAELGTMLAANMQDPL